MPKIVLEDFRGGRNTLEAVNAVKNNQSPDQENCWAPTRGIEKRLGFTTTAVTADSLTPYPEQLITTHLAASSLMRLCMIGRVVAHSLRYLLTTDNGTSFTWAGYRAGTCGTGGVALTTITGAGGTAWSSHVKIGDYFIKSGGTANRITAVNSDTEIVVTTAETITNGTSYKILKQLVQGSPCGLARFDVSGAENLWMADGTQMHRYDGTDVLTVTTAPALIPKILLPHKNYMFGLRHDNTTIIWSAIKDATSWPAANTQTITNVGDPIRGGVVYSNSIIIFCRNSMYRLTGDTFDPSNPTYVLDRIPTPPNFNFTFSRCVAIHQGILKFLTADGWYGYAGGSEVTKISNIIQADVASFRRLAFAAEAMQDSAHAFVHNDRLWCVVPDNNETPTDTLNSVYVQDENGAWWKWPTSANTTGGEFGEFALAKFGASGTYQLMAGSVGTNKLSVVDTGNSDDSTAIDGYWITKEIVFPNEVEFVTATVTMEKQSAGNLTFSFSIDRRTFVDKTCDMTSGAGNVIRLQIPIGRVGKAIRLKVRNATLAQTFKVYAMEFEYMESEAVRA